MANMILKAFDFSTSEIINKFKCEPMVIADQLTTARLLTHEKYREVFNEKDSGKKARIMAMALRDMIEVDKNNFQNLVGVLKKEPYFEQLANYLEKKLGELAATKCSLKGKKADADERGTGV